MVKLVDTADLKSAALKRAYGYESRAGHQLRQVIASYAGIAQLVERNLAKVEVASSSLVSRSRFSSGVMIAKNSGSRFRPGW